MIDPSLMRGLGLEHPPYNPINFDTEYAVNMRKYAMRGKIALAFWAILAIAGFALLYKAFM